MLHASMSCLAILRLLSSCWLIHPHQGTRQLAITGWLALSSLIAVDSIEAVVCWRGSNDRGGAAWLIIFAIRSVTKLNYTWYK